MADVGVTERRLRPIQDAVAGENWKQALKECEKWQKKGEKSDKFLALKAYVLVNQPDNGSIAKGETEALQLCQRTPAVTDLDAITTLQDALDELSLGEQGAALYERAAAASPNDQSLLMTWLNNCLDNGNWQSAQKATMALRKAFPNERNYDFWNILLCFLVHVEPSVPEKESAMFGMLAYRMINKAAASIPTDQDQILSPGKAVTTPEEIALLAQIYIKTGHAAEAVELLSGPTLNQDSKVGSQDPQLILSLLFSAITAAKQWDAAVQVCEQLLQKVENRGDDRIWNTLIEAYAQGDAATRAKVKQLLESYNSTESAPDRACVLANLRLLEQEGASEQQGILKWCQIHYTAYGEKSFAFQDLRPSLQLLEKDAWQAFLESTQQQDASPGAQLFGLKAHRLISNGSPTQGLEHTVQALKVYKASSDNGHATAEAPILAALSLIGVACKTKSPAYMLRAAALLQLAFSKHEAHFPFAVLLITIYRYLGLFSLAIATFVSLSVKNLQFETVAHQMFTRISTLHPDIPSTAHTDSEDGSETIMDPAVAVDTALAVNAKVADGLAESIKRGLRENSYSNILDAIKTRRSIQSSLGKRMFQIEERKLARMTGDDDTDNSIFGLSPGPALLVDIRDSSFLSTYSANDEAVWKQLACGPEPDGYWLDSMTLHENLRAFLRLPTSHEDGVERFQYLEAAVSKLQQETSSENPEIDTLTWQERSIHVVATKILKILKVYYEANTAETHSIAQSTKAATDIEELLTDWLSSHSANANITTPDSMTTGPNWNQLHSYYTAYEASSLVLTFLRWIEETEAGVDATSASTKKKSKNKNKTTTGPEAPVQATKGQQTVLPSPDLASNLRKAANDLVDRVKEQARPQKKALNEGGVLSGLVDVVMGHAEEPHTPAAEEAQVDSKTKEEFETAYSAFLESMGGEVAVEVVVSKWLASWEDALNGVLNVDVGKVAGVGGSGRDGAAGGGFFKGLLGKGSGSGKGTKK